MTDNRVVIFDTTLRDGEQSPGASMTKDEKLRIARALERLNVDVIEAGFAIASEGDFDAVKSIAANIRDSSICSLSRALDADIDCSAEALKAAANGRIHTFIATSPIHMRHKLKMESNSVIEQAVRAVKRARNQCPNVEFSCEDAGRSELDFLCRIIEKAIDAGASTINIPDTVGYALPHEFGETIRQLIERIPNSGRATFSVHCHNDLGLAVANSLSAVLNGARQVECTINGLGERAGNASLEELVMSLRTRSDSLGLQTGIATEHIVPCSRLVSGISGFPVQPNKAIVGANAFSHESGIHQDGVLKHRETYEIMKAEDVGWHTNKMVLGKLSGRNAFNTRMEELGITFSSKEELDETFTRFKLLADKKREIFDDDLQALVNADRKDVAEVYQLKDLDVVSTMGGTPEARVILTVNGEDNEIISTGDGPVDAIFKAIESITHSAARLELYSVNAITSGTDSQGDVTVRLSRAGRIVNGGSADTDIIVASAKAYVHALNLLESRKKPLSQISNI